MSEGTETEARVKKVTSEWDDSGRVEITITAGAQGTMVFNLNDLPEDIQGRLAVFGLYKKLGTQGAAAGKDGVEAEESIENVYASLKAGNWSARPAAAPKISYKEMAANLENLDTEEQDDARKMLAKLGFKL